MDLDKMIFLYFNKFCIGKFGLDFGNLIFIEAKNLLSDMKSEADYKNSKYIKWHMDENMLPSIAIYLAFKKFDSTSDNALDFTDQVLQMFRLKMQKKNKVLGRLPFGYSAFKMFCKSVMNKQYPEQGWDVEWIKYNDNEIHFNMKSCIYFEITKKYNCPEMCTLFCKNDDVVFEGYKPAIIFERNGTIARGQQVCDFHYKNSNNIK
ncbi:MAG TPA: L-2-amino-thiazoline-4-carboxylic acid hydrolase [Oscillospiraceae bacterium]|nr:L-2-amino-thiazoline-4-carboxylic acid hydrolase [Oscillospiraceae bacterium]